jgi:hypothetical protein
MLGVTSVALALAVGMSIVAMRLLRGERHRSAARVAALESAAFDDLEFRDPVDDVDEPLARRWIAEADEADEADEEPIDVTTGPMFAATDEPAAPGRRWFALAGVALVMAGRVGTIYVVFKPATVDAASPSSSVPATGLSASVPASAAQTRPIELLSLKHTVDGSTFTLVGLVVNPIDAAPLSRVVAVVYLFDKDGAYFASGKASLEFPTMRPGEESPFTITVAHVGRIGKYRVGFRRDDGSVIAHLDKRGQRAGSMTEVGGE